MGVLNFKTHLMFYILLQSEYTPNKNMSLRLHNIVVKRKFTQKISQKEYEIN